MKKNAQSVLQEFLQKKMKPNDCHEKVIDWDISPVSQSKEFFIATLRIPRWGFEVNGPPRCGIKHAKEAAAIVAIAELWKVSPEVPTRTIIMDAISKSRSSEVDSLEDLPHESHSATPCMFRSPEPEAVPVPCFMMTPQPVDVVNAVNTVKSSSSSDSSAAKNHNTESLLKDVCSALNLEQDNLTSFRAITNAYVNFHWRNTTKSIEWKISQTKQQGHIKFKAELSFNLDTSNSRAIALGTAKIFKETFIGTSTQSTILAKEDACVAALTHIIMDILYTQTGASKEQSTTPLELYAIPKMIGQCEKTSNSDDNIQSFTSIEPVSSLNLFLHKLLRPTGRYNPGWNFTSEKSESLPSQFRYTLKMDSSHLLRDGMPITICGPWNLSKKKAKDLCAELALQMLKNVTQTTRTTDTSRCCIDVKFKMPSETYLPVDPSASSIGKRQREALRSFPSDSHSSETVKKDDGDDKSNQNRRKYARL